MQKSKLILGLKSLNRGEFRRFREFVHSPYHNKNRHVQRLMNFLADHYPQFKLEHLTRERLFCKLYPEKADQPNELKVRHLMSMLFKLWETFLVLEAQGSAPVLDQKVALLKELRRRNLSLHFTSALKEAEKLEGKAHHDIEFHYLKYLLEVEKDEFLKQEKGRSMNLQVVSSSLDNYYLANKLRQSCVIVNHQNMFQEQFEIKMLDGVLDHLNLHTSSTPLIRLYQSALLSLREPNVEDHFFELKKGLVETERIPPHEGREIHTLARNYCIKRLNEGNRAYLKELFELYQLAIEQELLSDLQGHFPSSAFKNIVTIGLRLGEQEWVREFISVYADQLDERIRESYRSFNLAKYHFDTGEFRKVASLLHSLRYEDPFIQLDSRILLLKCYFELEEIDLLEALLASFSMYISRHKILGYHRENYQNIVGFTRKLLSLGPDDKAERRRLLDQITETAVLTEKDWLLAKLGGSTQTG